MVTPEEVTLPDGDGPGGCQPDLCLATPGGHVAATNSTVCTVYWLRATGSPGWFMIGSLNNALHPVSQAVNRRVLMDLCTAHINLSCYNETPHKA